MSQPTPAGQGSPTAAKDSPTLSAIAADDRRSEIIKANPIGDGLASVRNAFHLLSLRRDPDSPEALDQLDNKDLSIVAEEFVEHAKKLAAASLLPATRCGSGSLRDDLSGVRGFTEEDLVMAKPLLRAAIATRPDDVLIWERAYQLLARLQAWSEPQPGQEAKER